MGKKAARKQVTFSNQLADDLCDMLSRGVTLREICQSDEMPTLETVYRWIRDDVGGLREKFYAADALKYVAWEDECIAIADDSSNDFIERKRKDGTTEEVFNTEHVQRGKLRIDTRTKFMRARRPDLYSEKSTMEHVGKDGGPVQVEDMSMIERARLVGMLLKSGAIEKQRGHGVADDSAGAPAELPPPSEEEAG